MTDNRAPRWLKPANRIYKALLRRGVVIGRLFPTQLPTGVGFVQRAGLVTDGSPGEFEALAGRLPVFRIDPIT